MGIVEAEYLYRKGNLQDNGGEAGIRTLDRLLTYAGFQDRCIQPLCHLSKDHDNDWGRMLGD